VSVHQQTIIDGWKEWRATIRKALGLRINERTVTLRAIEQLVAERDALKPPADDGEITGEKLLAHGWHHSGGGYWGRVGEAALDVIRYPDGQWTVSFRTPAGLAVTGPVAGWGQFRALCQCLGVPLRAGAKEGE
jgi:hypothetical protein